MNWFDVRIAFPFGLVRSYLDFLLSFEYPLRVLNPFKKIAKASRTSGILTLNRPGEGGGGAQFAHRLVLPSAVLKR